MWVATERRGWCLEVPLFPLHPNLQSPSSRPFLKLRALEPIQDTPPQPPPCRVVQILHPCLHVVGSELLHWQRLNSRPLQPRLKFGWHYPSPKTGQWAFASPGKETQEGPPAPPFIINILQPLDSALSFHLPWEGLGVERGAPAGRMVTLTQLRTEAKGMTLVSLQVYDWPGAAW